MTATKSATKPARIFTAAELDEKTPPKDLTKSERMAWRKARQTHRKAKRTAAMEQRRAARKAELDKWRATNKELRAAGKPTLPKPRPAGAAEIVRVEAQIEPAPKLTKALNGNAIGEATHVLTLTAGGQALQIGLTAEQAAPWLKGLSTKRVTARLVSPKKSEVTNPFLAKLKKMMQNRTFKIVKGIYEKEGEAAARKWAQEYYKEIGIHNIAL